MDIQNDEILKSRNKKVITPPFTPLDYWLKKSGKQVLHFYKDFCAK